MKSVKTKKTILLVAMTNSIHTARWVQNMIDQGWDIHIFPSFDNGLVHPDLKNVTIHHLLYWKSENTSKTVKNKGIPIFSRNATRGLMRIIRELWPKFRVSRLIKVIRKIKPNIIHSMEIQSAGYLVLEAKNHIKNWASKWVVTNWGSDIYLYGRIPEHESKIKDVMAASDYYSCECKRDVQLARAYGFKGVILPVFPNSGGLDIAEIKQYRRTGSVSQRKCIMLKGYQNWAGRALVGLRALERCSELLYGYQVIVYSATTFDVMIAAELFMKNTGIPIVLVPHGTFHKEILKLHGKARISIGLSISDGISTSLLEAMAMGSFPIQSFTACANEWLSDGKTGILVHPEDVDKVEEAIRRALTDDLLVDHAAEENLDVITEKLDNNIIREKTIEFYNMINAC